MASKTYTSSVFSRTARPRSERLRKLGVAAGSASGSISSSEGSITMNLWGTQVTNGATINTPIDIRDNELDYINIGGIRLTHDSTNNALKVSTPSGGTANLYATGGVSAYGIGSGSGSGSGSVYEVWVGSSEPEDENIVIWIEPEAGADTVSGVTIDANGHLIVTTAEVNASLKAKIDGVWTAINSVGSVDSGSNVVVTKCNQYPSGVELAKMKVDGIEYVINAPAGGSSGGGNGTVITVNGAAPDSNGNVSLYIPTETVINGLVGAKHSHNNLTFLETLSSSSLLTDEQKAVLAKLSVVDGKLKSSVDFYSEGGISAYGVGSGGNTPDTGVDEVYIGTSEPTDDDVELWVNPNVGSGNQFGARVNGNGELILSVPDVGATLQAKYNNEWLNIAVGNGSGSSSSSGSTVSVTDRLLTGVKIATLNVDGVAYSLFAPVGGEGGGVTYSEGNGIIFNGSAIGVKLLSSNSYLTLNSNGLGVDVNALKAGLGLGGLAELGVDTEALTKYVKKSGDSIEWLQIGSAKLIWDSTNNALKIEGSAYATGGLSAFGVNGGSSGSSEGSSSGSTVSINADRLLTGTKIATLSIDGTPYELYAPNGGSNYTGSTHIGISASNVISLKGMGALAYKDEVAWSEVEGRPTKLSQFSNDLGLGALAYEGANTTLLTNYLKNYTDQTLVGKLTINESGTSLDINGNMKMAQTKYITWSNSVFDADGTSMPFHGVGVYGNKLHLSGYSGICMHTNPNGYVEIYSTATSTSDTNNAGKIKIGNAIIGYDSTNKALYLQNSDGSAMNFYTTGGVSAYGMFEGTELQNLTLSDTLSADVVKLGNSNTATISNVAGVVTLDKALNVSGGNLRVNGVSYADGGLEATMIKIGGGSEIKKVVGNSTIKSGDSNASIAISIGSNVYYVNAVKE